MCVISPFAYDIYLKLKDFSNLISFFRNLKYFSYKHGFLYKVQSDSKIDLD
jgi:hypothetical protein